MSLSRRLVALFAALAVGVAIGWFLGRIQPGARIKQLRSDLATSSDELVEMSQRWRLTEGDLDGQVAEKQKWKARTKDLRPRLEALRFRSESIASLHRTLVPAGATMNSARRIRGDGVDLLIVTWSRDDPDDHLHAGGGMRIYQIDEDGLSFVFEAHPNDQQTHLIVGPPHALQFEESTSSGVFLVDSGDVTGDGMPDLAIQDWNHGTGGCGAVRVLETSAAGLHQIFHRADCDHHIYIKASSIGYRTALSPPGCSSAHGCGWKRTWMRWNGSAWEVTNVRRKLY